MNKLILILTASIVMLTGSFHVRAADSLRIRVGIFQMDVADGDVTENMHRAEKGIRAAAKKGADLVCLPEAVDFGWLYQQARRDAFPIPGRYTDFLSALAKRLDIWISAGCLEKDGDKTYNSAVIIDRTGEIVLRHRKIITLPNLTRHLYDSGYAEDIKTVDTELGRIGLTICADNFNIENPKRVAALGAWLLITPHGYAAADADLPDNAVRYMNHIRNIARQTGMWVIGPNTCRSIIGGGEWKGRQHSGCSTIAAPTGKAMIFGKYNQTDMIIYDIVRDGKNGTTDN